MGEVARRIQVKRRQAEMGAGGLVAAGAEREVELGLRAVGMIFDWIVPVHAALVSQDGASRIHVR